MAAPIIRRAWYAINGNWELLYYARVACTDPSMTDTKMVQMLRFTHAYVTIVPVTNRTQLARRQWIISSISTEWTPGDLYKVVR